MFDTETETTLGQALLFGGYRVLRSASGSDRTASPSVECLEEGLFFEPGDDGPPAGLDVLRRVVTTIGADVIPGVSQALRLRSRPEFIEEVFYPLAYSARAMVVGFNLPFDLTRLALGWRKRKGKRRAFTLVLQEEPGRPGVENRYRPRIEYEHLDRNRAFLNLTRPVDPHPADQISPGTIGRTDRKYRFLGNFLDLKTLNFALTDRSDSLASACDRWSVEHGKVHAKEHGKITPEYVAYNRRDVQATAELYEKLMDEYRRHPVDLAPSKAYSPASIGKAYLDAMGIRPRLEVQPNFSPAVLGIAMSAYFGGRTETRIRRVPVPVVHVDVTSTYPTICSLVGLWRFVIAATVDVAEATVEVQQLLTALSPESALDPRLWPDLVGFVQMEPAGDVLPTRAAFVEGGSTSIGLGPYWCDEPTWYAIADVVASVLLTGRVPRILRAIRLTPRGVLPSLQSVELRGSVPIDPYGDDLFRVTVEQRQRARRDSTLPENERERLSGFLKVLGNATSYGIFAELNADHDLPVGQPASVTVYSGNEEFDCRVAAPEDAGRFCFPPLAAVITAGARLLLAQLQRLVSDAGGTYVFTDTDSMAIVSTPAGGPVQCPTADSAEVITLPWQTVDDIVGRFESLNPYDRTAVPGSIIKIETENYAAPPPDGGSSTAREQLFCYAIASKRYALFNLDANGVPSIRKSSEHGLGHLLDPADPEDEPHIGYRDWVRQLWLYALKLDAEASEGCPAAWEGVSLAWLDEPAWLDDPAFGRISVSTPDIMARFKRYNDRRPLSERVRPANFLLTAFVAPFGHPEGADPARFQLMLPYTRDHRQALAVPWTEQYTGRRYRVRVTGPVGRDEVRIQTYRDVLGGYRTHPEAKAVGPDGRPCDRATVGQLRPRPVRMATRTTIGKESNDLESVSQGAIHDEEQVITKYRNPQRDTWSTLIRKVLTLMSRAEIAGKASIPANTIADYLQGRTSPTPERRRSLASLAGDYARTALAVRGVRGSRDDALACAALLAAPKAEFARTCAMCAAPLRGRQVLYCSRACQEKAHRIRAAGRTPVTAPGDVRAEDAID